MRIAFFSNLLNIHQIRIADALWDLTGGFFSFVELAEGEEYEKKGGEENFSDRPYLLCAWASKENKDEAMRIALTADCCVFGGILSLGYMQERLKLGKLSFDMSERWLKRGLVNLLSPTIARFYLAYRIHDWDKAPLYKLCCSAYAAGDQKRLGTYVDKCFKWGYFTVVDRDLEISMIEKKPQSILWCGRLIQLKHPELAILLAQELRRQGYDFILNVFGEGPLRNSLQSLVRALKLSDVISIQSAVPNPAVLSLMRSHGVFLFTSDRREGWGAVANESMANGCALVASDTMGSTPYLVQDERNGLAFKGPSVSSSIDNPDLVSLQSLVEKVKWLFGNPDEADRIRQSAYEQMRDVWSPEVAAERLLTLSEALLRGEDTIYPCGPCSKA